MSFELMQRHHAQGWNACLDACIAIVCPSPHIEEERSCEEIKALLEALRRDVRIGQHRLYAFGQVTSKSGRS